jgi:hypothetical protein
LFFNSSNRPISKKGTRSELDFTGEIEEYHRDDQSLVTSVAFIFLYKDLSSICEYVLEVIFLKVSLLIDGKTIELNEFTKEFLGGTLQGAISTLQGINSNWKELEVKIKR